MYNLSTTVSCTKVNDQSENISKSTVYRSYNSTHNHYGFQQPHLSVSIPTHFSTLCSSIREYI